MAFICFALLILIAYSYSELKIQGYIFLFSFIGFFILIIRFNYILNYITIDFKHNQLVIKKIFSEKTFGIQEIDKIGNYVIPYLNYLKINNKTFFFISRTQDFTSYYFLNNPDNDITEIRNNIKEFNKNYIQQSISQKTG